MFQRDYSCFPKCWMFFWEMWEKKILTCWRIVDFAKTCHLQKRDFTAFSLSLSLSQGSVAARSISPVPSGAPDPPQDQTCPQEDS